VESGDSVAVEDPLYPGIKQVLLAAGARLARVAVDEEGLDPARLPAKSRLVFVTPSHQFPTGAIMPLARRLKLLEWAREKNAVIIEDDYDGEFHYAGSPVESLQGLDTEGRVLYVGTFSRTMFPALRIGYLVAPKSLVATITAAKWVSDLHSATLEQESLAAFISSGLYERHLRRLRRRNAARRAVLLEAIDQHLHDRVDISGDGAGAHIILWPRRYIPEEVGLRRAAERNVRIYGISRFHLVRPSSDGFMLGYSRMNEKEIREGIRLLAEVL
jgi:GntR family transcriptional regulator/MocR family aminotransferase